MAKELAKVLNKKEPHTIEITLSGGEPDQVEYERHEERDGKTIRVVYKGEFTSRTILGEVK